VVRGDNEGDGMATPPLGEGGGHVRDTTACHVHVDRGLIHVVKHHNYSRQCQSQEQIHMPRWVFWFIFNLQIKNGSAINIIT
jgi:hypothetical protein